MMIVKGNAGATKRFFAILFITSIVLSLAPSVVGPPERNFKKGQPELQQSMDNMIVREEVMKKSLHQPSFEDKDIPFLPVHKTAYLLKEAERILPETKDEKQKEWLEEFIRKLKALASVPEQSVANQSDNDSNSSITPEVAQSPSNSTVPDRNSLQVSPYDSLKRAVPESTPQPKLSNQITSELSVTIPDIIPDVKQVNYDTQHQPKQGENSEEDDELVRELESLRNKPPVDRIHQQNEAPETSSRELLKETNLPTNKGKDEDSLKMEKEKASIKEKLAKDVKELKNLGETDKTILDALHIDGFKPVDSKITQKETGNNEINGFEKTPQSSEEHAPVKRVLDEENSKVSTSPNQNNWNLPDHQSAEPPRQIYVNNTFLGMHINLPPMNPRVLRRQFYGMHRTPPFYRGGLKGTIQKLQAENHQNFLLRNHGLGGPNPLQQERFMHFGPVNARPYGAPQSVNRYPPDNPALYRYPNSNVRPIYMPYPPSQNLEQKNEVLNKSKPPNTYPTDPIQTELSEEMKRQLRDGKVILLSDSVVRSNFTADSEEVTEKPKTNRK